MPIPRPPRGIRWILTQTATYDILIALFASLMAAAIREGRKAAGKSESE
jgi:hypothetical protein